MGCYSQANSPEDLFLPGVQGVDLHRTLRFSSNPVIKESGVSGIFFESMMDAPPLGPPLRQFIQLRFIRDSKTKGRAAIKVFQGTNQS